MKLVQWKRSAINLIRVILVVTIWWAFSSPIKGGSAQTVSNKSVFLPYVSSGTLAKKILGLYPTGWIGDQWVIDDQLKGIGEWSGKQLSIMAYFIDFENSEAIKWMHLDRVYDQGYTPFMNIMVYEPMSEVSSGRMDASIRRWAQVYRDVFVQGKRFAYLAPFPEMNGDWVDYGADPEGYISAMQRIERIFHEENVPADAVQWVFAPNGESPPDHPFEIYYPGDDLIDVVGFSSYNFGACPNNPYKHFSSAEELMSPHVNRMREMAPEKPIFITQFATSSLTVDGFQDDLKDKWIREAYAYFSKTEGIQGLLYYNQDDAVNNCDLAMYRTWDSPFPSTYTGYRDGVQDPAFGYIAPDQLKVTPLFP